jgi:hypothetical protein
MEMSGRFYSPAVLPPAGNQIFFLCKNHDLFALSAALNIQRIEKKFFKY